MSDLELNKVMAGVLIAGITAMGVGIIAKVVVHPEELEQNAFIIETGGEGAAVVAAGPTGPEPVLAMLADADIERGSKLSKACAACHTFDKGGADRTGPNLWGIVGRAKASSDGFSYSAALAEKGGAWTYDELNHWLWDPKDLVSGTKMNYAGMSKAKDRASLIAWMRTLSDSPVALPDAAEMPEEAPAAMPEAMPEIMPEEAPAE